MKPATRTTRSLLTWAMLLVLLCALPAVLFAEAPTADASTLDYRLHARELAAGVYVVEGANADFAVANGCNIIVTGFIVTGSGVLVIDTGPSRRYGEQLRALIARTTREPILEVIHLNLHPDYFLGNQAFADVPRRATSITRAGMQRDAKAYEDNLYRLCGDWMKGTEALLPSADAVPGLRRIGTREIETIELRGHTESDLVLVDRGSGIVFAGGLVFSQRVPTTPHAQIGPWLRSLEQLEALPFTLLVPSHGLVADLRADRPPPPGKQDDGRAALQATRRYLVWIDQALRDAALAGFDMNDVLRMPVPEEFRRWAAFGTEYTRNVVNLYPRYEQAVLLRAP